MLSIALVQLLQTIAQVQSTPHHHLNPLQFALIVALVAATVTTSIASALAIVSLASRFVG